MIGDVPDDTGAVHDTVIAAAPGVVVSPVGAPGGAGVGCGVATADGSDGTLDPAAFRAVTANRYPVPFESPEI
ncbi:unannotated protein [freshwater metagenome]|uniref:Unannotated protein n=1 Tax=freshwater metagenome TaxID=449393 RepID=A0A6J6F222_9ZZZZ